VESEVLEKNLQLVETRVARACVRAGRPRSAVEIVAVSKTHPPEAVRQAASMGVRIFGESKIQEARAKIPESGGGLRWDFIGHLQSNKAREAVQLFELIHAVDSPKLAEILDKEADQAGKNQCVLLEVNVSGEKSKFGIKPDQLAASLAAINGLTHLTVEGLMTIAPFSDDQEKARPFFRCLRELRDRAQCETGIPLPHLSMGMTGDFEVAIEEGATLVRIGTALFGKRFSPKKSLED